MKHFILFLMAVVAAGCSELADTVSAQVNPLRFSFSFSNDGITKADMLVDVPLSLSIFSIGSGDVDDVLSFDGQMGYWLSGGLYNCMELSGNMVAAAPVGCIDRGISSFSYSPPSDVMDQVDLVGAVICPDSCVFSEVTVCRLEHLLSCIDFVLAPESAEVRIKYVKVSDVFDSGTWLLQDDTLYLSSDTGNLSDYRTDIPYDGSGKLMMIPQVLPPSATMELSVEFDGETYELSASLAGHRWEAGKHLTYKLNCSGALSHDVTFDLTISDWKQSVFSYREYL